MVGKCALIGNLKEPASFGVFMAVYKTSYYKYVALSAFKPIPRYI